MLKLKSVSKYYYKDGVIASGITKVNLEFFIGEFVVITGESGSGKSTLLNVLSGLDSYEDGEMYINGEETSHYTEEDYLKYRRKYVSNIFQNFNLVNSYSVYDNIELAMILNGKSRKDIKKYINELIEKVGLKKFKHTKVSKLSGGQKQRVAIARALANDTPIIVADEPTGNLDSKASSGILELLHEISKDKLVIVVTHNKKEIEKYATRLIRMHDGKVLEDTVIKDIDLDKDVKEKEINDITRINKLYLGIKNAFNIPVKLILMIVIFLLISISLLTNYSSFKQAEYSESLTGYNSYFVNNTDKRIVFSKSDNSIITEDDYNKITNIKEIDYIVKNDSLNDISLGLSNNNMYLDGKIILNDIKKVDIGRLPLNDNEVVVRGSKNNYYLSDVVDDLLKEKFSIDNYSELKNISVVGVIYNEEDNNDYTFDFLLSNNILDIINTYANENFSNKEIIINNNYFGLNDGLYMEFKPNNNVSKGEVYVRDDTSMYCKNYKCLNKDITIKVHNVYYNDELVLKVKKVFNKKNSKDLLNIKYDNYPDTIFISKEDYNYLYNKGTYQSSVFVKEIKDVSKVNKELKNMGFNTLALKNSKVDQMQTIKQIFNIFKLIVIIILIVCLFFISYFIIKIIYKSRNGYYTTLRTLGSTKKVCINVLMKELFIIATLTYSLLIIFIILVNKNIIKIKYFKDLSLYVSFKEYIIVYLILILLSLLIAKRYGRKIFKDSIIKTYGGTI